MTKIYDSLTFCKNILNKYSYFLYLIIFMFFYNIMVYNILNKLILIFRLFRFNKKSYNLLISFFLKRSVFF